jgi:NAD(P)-dependent dehydrogenase (short-subunit alcohol dehydrogenase family)
MNKHLIYAPVRFTKNGFTLFTLWRQFMKILLIGAHGTVGQSVVQSLGAKHEIVTAGRRSGQYRVDLTQPDTLTALLEAVGPLDAIVCAAGNLHFGALTEMSAEQFNLGLQDKLLGQVRLALLGQHRLRDGGSITLTSGVLASEPIRQGANATAVNAAIDGFVRAAAIELPRGLRINAVSPGLLTESVPTYGLFFPGFETVPAQRVGLAYQRSVEGAQTGRVYSVL